MPVELWLQCTCRLTRPGDKIVAVGDSPAFGCWVPERSTAVLETSAATFPLWQVHAPVLLKDGPSWPDGCQPVEYKYVIIGKDGQDARWEELSPACRSFELDLPCLGFDGEDTIFETAQSVGQFEEAQPDRLMINRSLAVDTDSVIFRADSFGVLDPIVSSTWLVSPDWAPAVAGGNAVIGRGKHRNSLNPCFKLQYQLPLQLFVEHRRGRLLATLAQLCGRRHLPPGLWPVILAFLGCRWQESARQEAVCHM